MTRRSASNPRYRRDAELGKTRKSASSAKPSREAGEVLKPKKARAGGDPSAKGIAALPPEAQALQQTVFILMVVSVVIAGAWWYFFRDSKEWYGAALLGVGYAVLISAFYIDFVKLRPFRNAARAGSDGKRKDGE